MFRDQVQRIIRVNTCGFTVNNFYNLEYFLKNKFFSKRTDLFVIKVLYYDGNTSYDKEVI
jgi:hypothetical protein